MTQDLPPPESKAHMTLLEHLGEMRQRILAALCALIVATLLVFLASRSIIQALKTLAPAGVTFVQLTPGEVLMASLKLALLGGGALASPVILYQALRFVLPGLAPREKRLMIVAVFFGTLLFAAGIAFAYAWVVPPALLFLLDYGQDVARSQLSIARFIDFCASLLVLTGALFELPVVLLFLSLAGLVTSRQLAARWREALVGIFLAAAILTPSQDPLTLLIVGTALTGLYAASLLPIRLCGR